MILLVGHLTNEHFEQLIYNFYRNSTMTLSRGVVCNIVNSA